MARSLGEDSTSYTKEEKMTDPRDIAHDKKVRQEKKKHGEEIAPDAEKTPQLGKKTQKAHHASDNPKAPDEAEPLPSGDKSRG
jgi:hypothetical protein